MHRSGPNLLRPGSRASVSGVAAALLVAVVLSACSQVPDYANPVEWYNSAVGVFDDEEPAGDTAGPVPGENQPFPNLSTVPEAPSRTATLEELGAVAEGLAADRENARYTDENIAAQPPEPTPPTVSAPSAPPPVAQAQPVQAQPVQTQPVQTQAVAPPPTAVARAAPLQQPIPAQPSTMTPAVGVSGRDVNVRSLFSKLFSASGPRAVAPANTVTAANYASPTLSAPALSAPTPAPTLAPVLAPAPAIAAAPATGTASEVPVLDGIDGGVPASASKAAVVYFTKGSAKLTREGRKAVRKAIKLHKERGGKVRVVGHASSRTRELPIDRHRWVNFEISLERARSVAKELIRLGVPSEAVLVSAVADKEPQYYEWMPSGEAGNRRAEIFLEF